MTPKEKAQQLVDKYSMITKWKMGVEQDYVIKKAKECALIAVDMVIENLSYDPSTGGKSNEFYWLDVKKELQKL
jgi:hypothetical protein